MTDLTMSAIQASLSGLAARQRIIAQNIANAGTPGYLAGRVDFETQLRSALDGGDMSQFGVTTSQSLAPTNTENMNNVNVDEEILSQTETNLRYQLMTEAMNSQFHILHTALRRDL